LIGSYTDRALRETLNELEKAERLDRQERERLIQILSETETRINALGTRMSAAALVREAFAAEIEARRQPQEARG
jgi:hypothetical protein